MTMLSHYLHRGEADSAEDDAFILSAVGTRAFAARNGCCTRTMLRSGFSVRDMENALLAFRCAMTPLDRQGYRTMRFAGVRDPGIGGDETRVLTSFRILRVIAPRLIRIATDLVSDDMTVRPAGAVGRVDTAMLPAK